MTVAEAIAHNDTIQSDRIMMRINVLLFIIACLFWVDSITAAEGFKEATWGKFAYSYPAEMWAALMMAASAVTINGLMMPVKRWMVVAGAALHLTQFSIVAYSAIFTGGEFVVGIYAGLFFAPIFGFALKEAMRD